MSETIHVVCPGCDSVNRIPREKLGAGGKCGSCKSVLLDGKPLEVDTARFNQHLGRSGLPLLVDFWAAWCGPCKMMAPAFAQAAGLLGSDARLLKVDTEAEQGLAARYGIQSIPTMVLFKEGREVARQMGAMNPEGIVAWARQHL